MTTPLHHEPPNRDRIDLRLLIPTASVWFTALVLTSGPQWAAALVALGCVGALVLVRRIGRSLLLTCAAVLLLALVCTGRITAREAGSLRSIAEQGGTVELRGTVSSSTALSTGAPGTSRVLVALDALRPTSGSAWIGSGAAVQLFVTDDLTLGTRIEFAARLSPARSAGDRAVATARVRGEIRIRAGPDRLTALLAGRRAALIELGAALPGDAGALLAAVTVGDTAAVGELDPMMKAAGLAHLTAVSGAHFSMVGTVVLALVSWCGVPRRWRWLPVTVASGCFVLLVGPGPTVLRAALMGGVGVLGVAVGRPSRSVPALLAAVLVLLVADPWLCADLGFVLSVAATAGIATLAAPLADRVAGRLPSGIGLTLAVPIAAQAACAPVLLLIDPAVSLYAVPANIVAAPAVAPATIGGLLATVLAGWWPWAAECSAALAGAGCWWIGAVARVSTGLPGARVSWLAGWPGLVTLTIATGAGLGLLLRCRRNVAP